MKKIVILLSILVFLLSLTSCDTSFFSHSGQKVTVMVVGLDYKVQDTSKPLKWRGDGVQTFTVGNLGGTINDSKELGAALDSIYKEKKVEHEIIYMLSEGKDHSYSSPLYPTAQNVYAQIESLDLDEDDLFVFYFAGHGIPQQTFVGDVVHNDLHLITAEPKDSIYCTSLKYEDLLSSLRSLPCRSAVIIDACYSGSFDPMNSSTPVSFESSLKEIFNKDNIVTKDDNKISVLTAAKWNEKSWEGYEVKFPDGSREEHGQFTGTLLDILGWEHSNTRTVTVKNVDGSEVVANGYLGDVPWKLSLDDIYAHLFDDRDYPYVIQYPVLYYTNETINLVPAN